MKSVTIDALSEAMKKGVILIDVRERDEYTGGHVPSAVNLPLSELTGRLEEIPEGSYIICQSGARSMRACEYLEVQGIDVINVQGGTLAWTADLVEGEENV